MCFYIDNNHKRRKTAKEDIICYKVMYNFFSNENIFHSMFKNYRYVLGELVTSKLQQPNCGDINQGLHSYTTTQKAHYWSGHKHVIIKCVIHKGAKYYYSEVDKEYVSNKIITIKKIK